jgi:hypothetical protein
MWLVALCTTQAYLLQMNQVNFISLWFFTKIYYLFTMSLCKFHSLSIVRKIMLFIYIYIYL